MEIKARDILMIDTISAGNNKPWAKLREYMESVPADTEVNFDFAGISVKEPFASDDYSKLSKDTRVTLTFHNSYQLVHSARLHWTVNNIPGAETRLINIDDPVVHWETKEEKRFKAAVAKLAAAFETDKYLTTGTLPVYKVYDQIGQQQTIDFIEGAITKYSEDTGIKDIIVDSGNMSVQLHLIKAMAEMYMRFKSKGIDVRFASTNKEYNTNMDMRLDICEAEYDDVGRLTLMKKKLCKNKVGVLIKYREGKAKDEFGRYGKGEQMWRRVAIFVDFVQRNGEVFAHFRSYRNDTFYTKVHWALEHDGEELKRLACEDHYITPSQLGIYNDFIGSSYHFSTPIQYGPAGTERMFNLVGKDKVISQFFSIPERAKAVFDSFGIEYDKESLVAYIHETTNILVNYKEES